MNEKDMGLDWVEQLPPPKGSQFVFIRHGESEYTGTGLDLTQIGVNQAKITARAMGSYLRHFDKIKVVVSPAARTQSTASLFVQELGIIPDSFETENLLRHVDIKDLSGFINYQQAHSTSKYGELWLMDEYLARDNSLTESRASVESRARTFLINYSKFVTEYSRVNGRIGVLAFTHFEVIMYYLKGIYPGRKFPIKFEDGVQNAEPVIVQTDDPNKKRYNVTYRGISRSAGL